MKSKRFLGIIALAVCAVMVFAVQSGASDKAARDAVVAYAERILNYTWTADDYVLLYNRGTTQNGDGTINFGETPVVAIGTIRGIPYTLGYGDVNEVSFAAYDALTNDEKTTVSIWYSSYYGNRASMKYGMACATFVTDCILQGLTGKGLTRQTYIGIHNQSGWKDYIMPNWSTSDEAYSALKEGDYVYVNTNSNAHVMLVTGNNGSQLTVIDQTPPDSWGSCEKPTYKYVSFRNLSGVYYAKQVCMNCDTCKRNTTGTHTTTQYYSWFRGKNYYPMYVKYDDTPDTPPTISDAPYGKALTAGYYYSFQCEADTIVSQWGTSRGVVPSNVQKFTYNTVPPDLSIDSSTGELSGTVSHTSQGKNARMPLNYCFNINARNSAGVTQEPALLTVWEPPAFATDALYDGEVNKPYTQSINAEGTEYSMRWKIISGQLPPGLSFNSPYSNRTATISGTPTTPGTYKFTVRLYNCVGLPETTAVKEYTIKITGIYPESNMWIEGNFKNGTVGEYYFSSNVSLYFRSLVYLSRWILRGSNVSVVSGSLPPGTNLSWSSSATWVDSKGTSATIYLVGTPTKAGTYTFTIRAQNCMGGYTDSTQTVYIAPKNDRPFIDSNMSIVYTFIKGKLGVSYNDYVLVFGGTSPYTVTKTLGIIPPGLEIKTNGRFIYLRGKPTRYGTYNFTLRATGAHNGYVDKAFTITIANNSTYARASDTETGKPKLATKKLPDATTYSDYNIQFEAGGTTPITWSFTGNLPEGFVSTDSGVIFGVPTEEGKYKFRVTATNSEGSASKSFTLKVLPQKPSITTITIPDGTAGEPYSYTLEAEGESLKFSKSGQFPKGLKLNKTTGEISGTPSQAGSYTFKVKAKNKAGRDTVEYQVMINEALNYAESGDVVSAANTLPARNTAYHEASSTNTELYLLNDDSEIEDSASVAAGMPLTFRAGELDDEDYDFSGLRVFVDDEEIDGVSVSPEGTFTLPGDLVHGSFTVYASWIIDGQEVETSEIDIEAEGDSSGSCNVNFTGMFLLIMSGIVLLKKK